jgi:PAS domain S-box-containing protein
MSLPACLYFIWKTQARFFAGDLDGAVAAATRAQDLLWSVPSFQELPEHHYYAALALAARYPVATAAEQAGYLQMMRVYQSRFRTWTESCPKNYAGKHLLISAEIARLSGGVEEAVGLYEEAIDAARASGFVQCEAVGWELASRFYRQRRFEVIADAYLREARACYVSWGAEGKVRQLDRLHPGLRGRADAGAGTRPEQLDVISVAKASQAISREVMLPELLKTMLRLIVEQTGAQQGWFLAVREGRMWLAAATEDGSNEVTLEPSGPATGEIALPLSILNYVRRTGETVCLDDAAVQGSYVDDPYVAKRRPKSVLCLPIVLQSKPVGLVYLENNLTTHAFSADRMLVLQLLAGQAAISLENARLYADVHQQQAATRASQAQLQAIVDSSTAVIFLKDTKGRYLLVNRRYEEIFALTREFVVGKTDYDVLPRDVAETVRANDNKVLAAGTVMEWEELIPHGGSVHTYLALKFPLRDAAGSIYGVCGISTDITARKHGEDALKQAIRMRDEFLSVASHELRTPLTTLMLSLDAIRRGATGSQRDKWMASAWQGGERLQRLFEELLDISRLEVGQMGLDRTNVDLEELVRRVVARFEPAIASAQCTVHVEATALWGCWDRSRIDQVIANLLANALKFGCGRVEISVRPEGEHAVLSVRDHGIGIELAQQQAIFERFQRAVSERHSGGLGLGLYICRRIIEAHGGSIRVDSQPGAGATFTVELPLADRGATSAT